MAVTVTRKLAATGLLTALAVLVEPAGQAVAQSPLPSAPARAEPSAAAKAAYESLPETERRAIQDALVWTGDYNGGTDGGFGRQTFESIVAYQRRAGLPPTGILDDRARAALKAAASQIRTAQGFTLVDDPVTGVRIGIPERFLVKRDAGQAGSARWQSADEKVTLQTRSLAAPEGGLQSLYDRNVAIQTPGRQVTYKIIRPDFYVIAGETPTGRFYTRYAIADGQIRGFSIGYDKALAKDVDRLVVAIANSFVPFPKAEAPAPAVAAPSAPAPNPGRVAGGRIVGTGVVVGARQVATVLGVSCANLRAGNARVRPGSASQGFAVLELEDDVKAVPLRFAPSVAEAGAQRLVLAQTSTGGGQLVATPASVEADGTLSAPLQPGAQGAPVFDLSGRLRGLVQGGPDERRVVAGTVPPARYRVEAGRLSAMLTAETAEGAPRRTGDLVAELRGAVVPLTCGP